MFAEALGMFAEALGMFAKALGISAKATRMSAKALGMFAGAAFARELDPQPGAAYQIHHPAETSASGLFSRKTNNPFLPDEPIAFHPTLGIPIWPRHAD